MTPNDIEVLLHYHTSPEPHPRIHAGAVQSTLCFFHDEDILRKDNSAGNGFRTTYRGRKLVTMLCETPFPQQFWVDPRKHGEV
jgi:hypothetical protein